MESQAETLIKEQASEVIVNIKVLLGINDNLQDDLLNVITETVIRQLSNRLLEHPLPIPEELSYIIQEVAVMRFNRIGSEGFKSDDKADHKITFYDARDDFRPFLSDIEDYNNSLLPVDDGSWKQGKVIMI